MVLHTLEAGFSLLACWMVRFGEEMVLSSLLRASRLAHAGNQQIRLPTAFPV
jgi:hypothetical protein